MNDRSNRISRLLSSQKSRAAYIKAKLSVLVPSQIRALRLKSTNPPMPFQRDLAREAEVHQSRISMFETPGMANMTLETLSKIAAGLRTGLIVKFVPFSEMLKWENDYSLDTFNVTRLDEDVEFINPAASEDANVEPRPAELLSEKQAAQGIGMAIRFSLSGTDGSPYDFSPYSADVSADVFDRIRIPAEQPQSELAKAQAPQRVVA